MQSVCYMVERGSKREWERASEQIRHSSSTSGGSSVSASVCLRIDLSPAANRQSIGLGLRFHSSWSSGAFAIHRHRQTFGFHPSFSPKRVQTRLRHIYISVSCIFNGKWRSALSHPECFACSQSKLSLSSACPRQGQRLSNSPSITRKYRLKGTSKPERKIGTGGLTVMFT